MTLNSLEYQDRWESRSSIRSRPKKIIDFEQQGYFFPVQKQPLLLKDEVIQAGDCVKETILLQSFLKYLNDIITLEIKLINHACHALIYESLPVEYPEDIKLNAYTILIDEYYHVYMARDMTRQIKERFPTLKKIEHPISDAYLAATTIRQKIDERYQTLFDILAVCIFETTLVRELVEFFKSEEVHPSVRYYVNDHMNDESRHFSFFYQLLCYTWKNLPEDGKENIGKYLGEFVKSYLGIESDKAFNALLLNDILSNSDQVNRLIDELYHGFELSPEIPIVKNVLTVLTKAGLSENNTVKASFKSIHWEI